MNKLLFCCLVSLMVCCVGCTNLTVFETNNADPFTAEEAKDPEPAETEEKEGVEESKESKSEELAKEIENKIVDAVKDAISDDFRVAKLGGGCPSPLWGDACTKCHCSPGGGLIGGSSCATTFVQDACSRSGNGELDCMDCHAWMCPGRISNVGNSLDVLKKRSNEESCTRTGDGEFECLDCHASMNRRSKYNVHHSLEHDSAKELLGKFEDAFKKMPIKKRYVCGGNGCTVPGCEDYVPAPLRPGYHGPVYVNYGECSEDAPPVFIPSPIPGFPPAYAPYEQRNVVMGNMDDGYWVTLYGIQVWIETSPETGERGKVV